jgi:hypothetical protein
MPLFERAEKANAPLARKARFLFPFGARNPLADQRPDRSRLG